MSCAFVATMIVKGPSRLHQRPSADQLPNGEIVRQRRESRLGVSVGPDKLLDHLPVGSARKLNLTDDIARVAPPKDDAGRFYSNVGAGVDRDADVWSGECRSIVRAVADHGDALATRL